MLIRPTTADDFESIHRVHLNAFGETEGATVSALALRLLQDQTACPIFSFAKLRGSNMLGNIIFSAAHVPELALRIQILAPLAVAPEAQNQGIGRALIAHGIETLRTQNTAIVLVLGDPAYYQPLGFSHKHYLSAPYPLAYPQAWMARELQPGAVDIARGTVTCAQSLRDPKLW